MGRHNATSRRMRQIQGGRTVEVVDARTHTAHHLTDDAYAEGMRAKGHYYAVCGREVLPAALVAPPGQTCRSCILLPGQRSVAAR